MPLASGLMNQIEVENWIQGKEAYWEKYGYGPYAIFISNEFAGWGGLMPDDKESDLALVLLPKYWGSGKEVYKALMVDAYEKYPKTSIKIFLPNIRKYQKGVEKIGFIYEENILIEEIPFLKYGLREDFTIDMIGKY